MSRIYVEFFDSILSWIPKGLVVFVMYTVEEEYGQVYKGNSYLVHDLLIYKSESNQVLNFFYRHRNLLNCKSKCQW